MAELVRGAKPSGKLVERKKLICVCATGNNNKYIIVELYDSGDVYRAWGRVRADENGNLVNYEGSNSGVMHGAGKYEFDKFVYSKTKDRGPGKTYTEVDAVDSVATKGSSSSSAISNVSVKQIAKKQIEHSCPVTAELVEYLADVNIHQITSATALKFNTSTGLFSTPLGIVTPASVRQARSELDILADCIQARDWQSVRFTSAAETYLRLIPHDLGHRFDGQSFLPDIQKIREENDVLDALDASYRSAITQPSTKDDKKTPEKLVFDVKLTVVKDKRTRDELIQTFMNTRNRIHAVYSYKIKEIFSVNIPSIRKAFEKKAAKLGNPMSLWHGSPSSSCLSILKSGLYLPPKTSPHVTGALFSNAAPGIYASDQSTKALQYAARIVPGQYGTTLNRYFMFRVKFLMGKTYYPRSMSGSFPRQGYDSTFAEGGKCGYLRNNEMIVYSTDQVDLEYLLEFRPG